MFSETFMKYQCGKLCKFFIFFIQYTRNFIGNIENRLINCQLAVLFNKTCLNEDILPIYTNIIYAYTIKLYYIYYIIYS